MVGPCPTSSSKPSRADDLTVYGDGQQTRSICHYSDLIAGLYKLMLSDVTTPVNLGNPSEITMLDLARKIIAMTESKSRITFCDLPQDDPSGALARH